MLGSFGGACWEADVVKEAFPVVVVVAVTALVVGTEGVNDDDDDNDDIDGIIVGTEPHRRWEGRARHLQQLVLAMAGWLLVYVHTIVGVIVVVPDIDFPLFK